MIVMRGAGKAAIAAMAFVSLAVATWGVIRYRTPELCYACQRDLHKHSITTGLLDGKPAKFCCTMCAMSEGKQSGKHVQVTALTDFVTGKTLEPGEAFLVKNSDINPCMDGKGKLSGDKQPLHVHFDRCAPSLLSFASQQDAAAFAREHGGQMVRFPEVEKALR